MVHLEEALVPRPRPHKLGHAATSAAEDMGRQAVQHALPTFSGRAQWAKEASENSWGRSRRHVVGPRGGDEAVNDATGAVATAPVGAVGGDGDEEGEGDAGLEHGGGR